MPILNGIEAAHELRERGSTVISHNVSGVKRSLMLRLKSQGQVSDFVKKESAGIRHFEAANFLCHGPP